MLDLITIAIEKGARIYGSVSGGKDGQAMVRTLVNNGYTLEGLIHCDLGRMEWPQSMAMCERQAAEYKLQLHVLRHNNGMDLLSYIERRMALLEGTDKPYWPSADARYCTSDYKRGPSDVFYRSTGHGLIISAEGIRAEESPARSKKQPLTVRNGVTSDYYTYITGYNAKKKPIRKFYSVEQCLEMYRPDKRLVLTWYPVFNMTLGEVWGTYGSSIHHLEHCRRYYKCVGILPATWPFHPAYAMGNERVSCMLCVLGSINDLKNGAKQNPELLQHMIAMEDTGGKTFKNKFSLKELL